MGPMLYKFNPRRETRSYACGDRAPCIGYINDEEAPGQCTLT